VPRLTFLIDTAPVDTVKSASANDATPLLVVVASSAAIVIVLSVTATSIPSPPETCSDSERREIPVVPVSPLIVSVVATLLLQPLLNDHKHLL
jgi:hypothetical protein